MGDRRRRQLEPLRARTSRRSSAARRSRPGFVAAGAVGRDQGIRPAGPGDRRLAATGARRPRRRSSPRTPFAAAPSGCRRPISPTTGPAAAAASGWARGDHLDERLRERRDRPRRATPTRPRSRASSPVALGSRPTRRLLLSTGVIGTRLPIDGSRPARRRCAPVSRPPTDAGLAAAAEALRTTDTRDEGRDRRRSPCPIPTACGPLASALPASPRASG